MSERERDTKGNWIDPDDAPEWPDEVWERAQISVGGKVIREATGTLTRRGRPPQGDAPKQQVTLRLPRHVLDHFKVGGAGWQTRIGEVLERHAEKAKRKSA
ncbi:MAG TPA: BrnA antitoxin family protein [Allosphingosinicella sp.]|nr:BrnA antitoxin family protein [Allosphingosinicella sp.]